MSASEIGVCEINGIRIPKSNSYHGADAICLNDTNLQNIEACIFGRSKSFSSRLYRHNTQRETNIAFNTRQLLTSTATANTTTITPNHINNDDVADKDDDDNNYDNGEMYEALLTTPPHSGIMGATVVVAADDSDCEERSVVRRAMLRNKNRAHMRACACPRTFGASLRTCACSWYINYLLSFSAFCAFLLLAYLTRDYARRLLFWIETQNSSIVFLLFLMFFILVSFPIVFGYFLLLITSGYLFGCLKGLLTVILGANMGIMIAHITMASLRNHIPMQKIIKNETGRAILRVISGPRAFRVVLFTRLTPIPFGLQNAIFGVSSINWRIYFTATFLGLLPAQIINVYLGSTLRSMHEILNNHGTALTGYISIGLEVICGVALMFWVVQKARTELSETLLTDISNEGKLLDIQV